MKTFANGGSMPYFEHTKCTRLLLVVVQYLICKHTKCIDDYAWPSALGESSMKSIEIV